MSNSNNLKSRAVKPGGKDAGATAATSKANIDAALKKKKQAGSGPFSLANLAIIGILIGVLAAVYMFVLQPQETSSEKKAAKKERKLQSKNEKQKDVKLVKEGAFTESVNEGIREEGDVNRKEVDESPYYQEKPIAFPKPPDVRPAKCLQKEALYDTGNLTVSIVIPYLREKYQHIKGTVGSILAHTPARLLKEIVFISDGNTNEEAHEAKILKLSPLTRVIRLPTRHGLIYAKERGAREAKGDIVMFFEPHCVVGYKWLEPLVHMVQKKPNSLILPTLDYIPQDNWNAYSKASFGRYRFEWNFNLIYTNPPTGVDPETSRPFFAPATSGGIFAIRKDRFLELKLFDVPMHQWGGDQIELSFKAWRCGGSILVVPCSRVGHLFRDVAFRPYPVDVPQVVENYAKLARVWLEQPYLDAFLKVKPESARMALDANLTESRNNMANLKCKSMDWYVHHVDLELGWESTRICIPGAHNHPSGCKKPKAAPGRSTIDKVMPEADYIDWARRSEFFGNLDKHLDGDSEMPTQ